MELFLVAHQSDVKRVARYAARGVRDIGRVCQPGMLLFMPMPEVWQRGFVKIRLI